MKKVARFKKSHSVELPLILFLIFVSSFVFISIIKAEDPVSTCDPMTGLNPDGTNIGCVNVPSSGTSVLPTVTPMYLTTSVTTSSAGASVSDCNPMTGLNSSGTNIGCESVCNPMTGLNANGTSIGCSPAIGNNNSAATTQGLTTTAQPVSNNESTSVQQPVSNNGSNTVQENNAQNLENQKNESDLQKQKLADEVKAKEKQKLAEAARAKKEAAKKKDEEIAAKTTEEQMSEVDKSMQALSETNGNDKGIGQEIKKVAEEQNASQNIIVEALAKMAAKNVWLKKIIGYDRKAVSAIKEEMAAIRLRIKEIYEIEEQTKDKVAMSQLEDAANALIEQNAALDNSLQEEMSNIGVFGWFEQKMHIADILIWFRGLFNKN